MEFYILMLVTGALLTLSKDLLDFDFLGGSRVSVVFSTSIFMWGLVGIMGIPEPWAALVGAVGFGTLAQMLLSVLLVRTDIEKTFTGAVGKVNMDIDPDSKGKIIVRTDGRVEFFVARAANGIEKTIKVGTPVKIERFDGIIAIVRPTDEIPDKVVHRRTVGIFRAIYLFLKNFRERNKEQCLICYNLIHKRSNMVRCPHCGSYYHATHLEQWLEVNSVCPQCREEIRKL